MAASTKRISQQDFDDMVQENIDALGLEPDEALESTVEELNLQNVDLSCVVKRVPGTSSLDSHPVATATQTLKERKQPRGPSLLALEKALRSKSGDASDADAVAIATQSGTLEALLALLEEDLTLQELKQCCQVLGALLTAAPSMRKRFVEAKGDEYCIGFVQRTTQDSRPERHRAIAVVLHLIAAACRKCEPAKCKFMDPDFAEAVHSYLKSLLEEDKHREPSVAETFAVFASVTNPDDPESSASQTFMHSRLLAQQNVHLTILKLLQLEVQQMEEKKLDVDFVVAAANALRCLAVNDAICKELAEAGGVQTWMQLLAAPSSNEALVKAICNTLRQVSCSDDVKSEIMKQNGAHIFATLLTTWASNGEIFEGVIGLMTIVALRQPQFAKAFCEENCHDSIHDAFTRFQTNPKVLRQCCACIRNFVVRDDAIKQLFLALGVEAGIRRCKGQFPKICQDDASSALRDLGFDDYH